MSTTGRYPVSTSDNNPVLLIPATGSIVNEVVIYNSYAGTAEGYWSVGIDGELRKLIIGVSTLTVKVVNAGIYIWRQTDGSDLVSVEGNTLP